MLTVPSRVARPWATLTPLVDRFFRPTHAIPLDIFRVLVGIISAAYFVHLFAQVGDFSSPDGLIDHELTRQVFWYTRLGLFQPWMSPAVFRIVFAMAVVASLALAAGYRVRLSNVFLFLVAVSSYRWNFLVVYVDDGLMHLALFWLLLLPIGRTLNLAEWIKDREKAVERWKNELVPGGAMRCFLMNIAFVDFAAGLWKLTSPMWREGTALYAVLRLPISYAPDLWQPELQLSLRAANYCAMALELMLPAMFLFSLDSRAKRILLVGAVAFHFGIIATLRIPYANLVCIAALVVVLRHDIMSRIMHVAPSIPVRHVPAIAWRDASAVAFLCLLFIAMAGETRVAAWRFPERDRALARAGFAAETQTSTVDEARTGGHVEAGFMQSQHNLGYLPLWIIGIAQSYRLFDWIDDRNFGVQYDVVEQRSDGSVTRLAEDELFPQSLRSVLLQAYVHNVTWARIPRQHAAQFKEGLLGRFVQRYCRLHGATGAVSVRSAVYRLTLNAAAAPNANDMLMTFACRDGTYTISLPRDAPQHAAVQASSVSAGIATTGAR